MSLMRNPVFLLAWGLPAVAVVASVLSLLLTLRSPDGQLPEQYHWEGFQLDRDFSQAAHAARLGVHASISGFGESGRCAVQLRMKGTPPEGLVLHVAHATKASLDQHVTLKRVDVDSRAPVTAYSGVCQAVAEGHWRLELVDAVNGWAVRQSVRGSLSSVTLDAVAGQNE
jgi:hypothetical protein